MAIQEIREGEISSGTLRTEDLLPRFWEYVPENRRAELCEESRGYANLIREMEEGSLDYETDSDIVLEFMEAISYTLEEEAAKKSLDFGTTEGDGACFGFWLTEDPYENVMRDMEWRDTFLDDDARF